MILIVDKGCNYGGVFSCQNDGNCKSDGYCECKIEFSGLTCSGKDEYS